MFNRFADMGIGVPKGGKDLRFGDGSDGVLNTTGNVTFDVSEDGPPVIKQYSSITINSEHTITTSNRCGGLILFSLGDVVINGIIDMSSKKPLKEFGVLNTFLEYLLLKQFNVPLVYGGSGGNGGNGGRGHWFVGNEAQPGGIGTHGGLSGGGFGGGGGGGGAYYDNWPTEGGAGGDGGICGLGFGGEALNIKGAKAGHKGKDGLYGGGGGGGLISLSTSSTVISGAGADYPGGGGGGGNGGTATETPESGTTGNGIPGGAIYIIAKGNITIGSTGKILVHASGTGGKGGKGAATTTGYGGNGGGGGGGGGAGGGLVVLLHKGTFVNNGQISGNGSGAGSGGDMVANYSTISPKNGESGQAGSAFNMLQMQVK